jgi:hypothetical protein
MSTTTVKDRLHFDLRADGVSTAEELERLLALGAQRTDVGDVPDVSWWCCPMRRAMSSACSPGRSKTWNGEELKQH